MDESKDESITIPKAHQLSECATTGCTVDADQLMVKCNECKLFTHYRLSLKTDESNSFLEETRKLKHQITELKQKIKDIEHQHVSTTTELKEYEVSPSSPLYPAPYNTIKYNTIFSH